MHCGLFATQQQDFEVNFSIWQRRRLFYVDKQIIILQVQAIFNQLFCFHQDGHVYHKHFLDHFIESTEATYEKDETKQEVLFVKKVCY